MKFIRKITRWFKNQFHLNSSKKFKFKIVEDVPEVIPKRLILIISEGNELDSLVFKCPCGCNSTIFLNLLQDASPRWKYRISKKGNISISPSIWRKVGCKSHFFVREGNIEWV